MAHLRFTKFKDRGLTAGHNITVDIAFIVLHYIILRYILFRYTISRYIILRYIRATL